MIMYYVNFIIIVIVKGDPCNRRISCSVEGETCAGRLCKCGDGISCKNRVSGSYCDVGNSKCKCSKNVEACKYPELCKNGTCGKA